MIFKKLNEFLVEYIINTNGATAVTAANIVAQQGLAAKLALTTKAIVTQSAAWLTTPFGIIATLSIVAYGLVKAYNNSTMSLKKLQEQIEDTTTALNALKTEQESLSQKDDRTDVEEKRLELLNAQITAKEELLKQDQRAAFFKEWVEKGNGGIHRNAPRQNNNTVEYLNKIDEYNAINPLSATDLDNQNDILAKQAEFINDFTSTAQLLQTAKDAGYALSEDDETLLAKLYEIIEAYNDQSKAAQDSVVKQEDALSSLKDALDGVSNGSKSLSDAITNLKNGTFDSSDISDLISDFPDLVDEIQDYVDAIESGLDPEKAQITLLDQMQAAMNDFNTDNIAESIKNVIDATDTYGKSSYKAQEAMDSLAQYCPGLRDALYNPETGMWDISDAALNSASSLLAAMEATLKLQMEANNADLSNLKSQLSEIESQASATSGALYGTTLMEVSRQMAEKQASNSEIEDFLKSFGDIEVKINTSGLGGGSSSGSSSETEEYIADVDELYEAEKRLSDIQSELSKTDIFKDLATNSDELIENINKTIVLLKEEQNAYAELKKESQVQISETVDKLRSQGFDILYDPATNNLLVKNYEHINELGNDSKLTQEEINDLRKESEQELEDIKDANDANIQRAQKELEIRRDINSAYKEESDVISNTVEKALDKVSKLLDEEKEAYETQKSNMETAASTVISYINDQIDALQNENDELDKQISLQEKLEALDKAKTQRNKRIFIEGNGYVWQADQSAVNSAQSEYDAALRENELDKKIDKLQKYADAWQDAIDSYQNDLNESITESILGRHWQEDIYDTDDIKDFEDDYSDICDQLNEDVYGSVAYQIKYLNDLSDKWDETVNDADLAKTDYNNILDFINAYEDENYRDRLKSLKSFVSDAIREYESLASAAISSSSSKLVRADSNGNAPSGLSSGDYVETAGGIYQVVDAGTSGANYNSKSGYWSVKAFSSGGVVDYTGLANVHGANAAELMLNNIDVARVYDYIHSGDILSQTAANMLMSNGLSVGTVVTPNSTRSQSFTMGNIYVSGVDNVGELVSAIKSEFPNSMLQAFYAKE